MVMDNQLNVMLIKFLSRNKIIVKIVAVSQTLVIVLQLTIPHSNMVDQSKVTLFENNWTRVTCDPVTRGRFMRLQPHEATMLIAVQVLLKKISAYVIFFAENV